MDNTYNHPERATVKQLSPRSTPKQSRSRQRVDYILDVTEKLVLQSGYEVITAQMISEATNISPGVLYHYFPGKHGIFAAVVQRAFARLEALMREIGDAAPAKEPYPAYVDRVIDQLATHWKKNRSAMLLWQALEHTPQMEPITAQLKKRALERNQFTIKTYFPKLTAKEIHIKAIVMQGVTFSLLRETLFLKPKERASMLDEVKRIISGLGDV